MYNSFLVGIVRIGTSFGDTEYSVEFKDRSVRVLDNGVEVEGVSIYSNFGIVDLEIETPIGVYAADIKGSGLMRVYFVEDESGSVLSYIGG